MEQKFIIFGDQYINKNAFHKDKKTISIAKVGIKRIVLSKNDSYGKKGSFKYFIGYITTHIKPLCIKLPKVNEYVKYLDRNNNCMIFLVCDEELLKKSNEIWDKINNLLKRSW